MKDSGRYVLSIDGGTESVRAGVFDDAGRLVHSAASPYGTDFPKSGWAEQDPDEWWHCLGTASRRCLQEVGIPPSSVQGVCLDATTCTLVPLDTAGRVLRPAFLWMDVRAAEQARRIFETGHESLRYSPSGCNAEWMVCKALWMKEHEPEVYERTADLLEYTDWLVFKLTGTKALNINTVTQRWFYNDREWKFPADLYRQIGIPDLVERMPKRVVAGGEPVGGLTEEAAEHIGLQEGTPVFEGGGDAFVSLLGLGITASGPMAMVSGSSTVFVTQSDHEVHGEGLYGGFPDAVIPGLWLLEAGQTSSGSVLAWYKRNFLKDLPDDEAYALMDAEAQSIPPGSGGLVMITDFQGNRSPYSDSSVRGALWGLSLATSRAEIFRAIMEGVAYGAEQIRRTFEGHGIEIREFVACGGATKSELYMQIISDVTGLPIRLTKVPEAPLLGGAILAAAGCGWYRDVFEAAERMVHTSRTFEPDGENHRRYLPFVEHHRRTYEGLGKLMRESAT